jgi:transcriptional regulator with XRE-family HTH domain
MQPDQRRRTSSDVEVPRLQEVRHKRALSQKELATLSGVSRITIIKLEGGRPAWPVTVRKLAKALKVDPSELQ